MSTTKKTHAGFLKYFANTSWLFGEKVYRLGSGLFISIWMARFLGPEQFGILNYASSFVAMFAVLASLGLDKLIVRELIVAPNNEGALFGSALFIRVIGAIFLLIATNLTICQFRSDDKLILALVMIFSIGHFFRSLELIRYWFEAHVKGKFSSLVGIFAITISVFSKIVFILIKAPLVYFAFGIVVENIFLTIGLVMVYLWHGNTFKLWRPKFKVAGKLLLEAWPLVLAGMLYTAYTRIDQLMLGEMVGQEAVGIYAAAVKLSEGWLFLPVVIVTSLYPAILNAKKINRELYLKRTQHLFNVMVVIAIFMAVGVGLVAVPVVGIILGSAYEGTASILIVHVWGGVFLAMSGVSYRYFIAESLQKFSFYRGLTGLVVNVLLNVLLIPAHGPMGAAVATVISQGMALYLFNASNSRTREVFVMQTRALLFIGVKDTMEYLRSLIAKA